MISRDGRRQQLEKRGADLIWEAASLHPGVPGHATRTSLLVGRLRALFREAAEIGQPEPPDKFCTTHGRAHWDDGDRTCRWAEPADTTLEAPDA